MMESGGFRMYVEVPLTSQLWIDLGEKGRRKEWNQDNSVVL